MATATKKTRGNRKSGGEVAEFLRENLTDRGLLAEMTGSARYCVKPVKRAEITMDISEGTTTPGKDVRDDVHGVEVQVSILLADGSHVEQGMYFDLIPKGVSGPELLFKGWN